MLVKAIIILVIPAVCQGWFFGSLDNAFWNGLIVSSFTSSQVLPRTRTDAVSQGWVNIAPGIGCNDHANFKGERFWKYNDLALILIFDPTGYIAGVQTGIQQNYPTNPNGYPFDKLKNHPFILDDGIYFITAYFVNPSSVCTGRTSEHFREQGMGTGLWIQNGTDPVSSSILMPETISDADQSMWSNASCYMTSGIYYWYNITNDMNCDNFFPVFLIYKDYWGIDQGRLSGFGWAFAMDLVSYSNIFENPPSSAYGAFLDPVPDCLSGLGNLSTLHIYINIAVSSSFC